VDFPLRKIVQTLIFGAGIVAGCQGQSSRGTALPDDVVVQSRDREILDLLFKQYSGLRNLSPGTLMVKTGTFFLQTPYVAQTLETDEKEALVINLREMDCTTYIENCLAFTRNIRSGKTSLEDFAKELETIRYRGGIRNGYPSRLHYFSDWIHDNENKKRVVHLSREIAKTILPNRVDFMSTHADSYPVLKGNDKAIAEITSREKEISERETWYVPKKEFEKYASFIQDGDIIAFTTYIEGLDISHIAIAVHVEGKLKFLHASTKEMKVVLSDLTLYEYMMKGMMISGIMVARPR